MRRSFALVLLAAGCSGPVVAQDAAQDRASAVDAPGSDGAGSVDVAEREDVLPFDGATEDAAVDPVDAPPLDDVVIARDATARADAAMDARADAARDAAMDAAMDAAPTGPRSRYFPDGWRPLHAGGRADAMGRALPDFAYAGYHSGTEPPPCGLGRVVATVPASNGDGRTNATRAIQSAIDSACAMGGGVVMIPAGTYRVTFAAPSPSTEPALSVTCRNLVLRGAGRATTRLWLDDPTNARQRAMIRFRGNGSLFDSAATTTFALAADTTGPTTTLELASTAGITAGAYIAVRQDNNDAFRAAHRMAAFWPNPGFAGIVYGRRVARITGTRVELDAPVHYPLERRYNARVYATGAFIDEVGIESLSVGMTENSTSVITEPGSDEAYDGAAGTAPYQVHASRAIEFDRVRDGWACGVGSFRPSANRLNVHVLSLGLSLGTSTFRITVRDSELGFPQYRGGGGNGYLYQLQGSDALVRDSRSERARHGFILNNASSGVVFLRDTIVDSRLSDDSHRFLAHANLYDNIQLDRAWLQAVNRGSTSTGAGFTATQHVFWNTHVVANHTTARGCAVESAQWGYGYLLGSTARAGATARLCPMSFTNSGWAALDQGAPTDETEREGSALFPGSLYEAQLALRCARESLACR